MLNKEENEILTRVGPGTLMGNLLRRYWTPALLSAELPSPDCPPIRVRLLGEDLIAFRDTDGKVGLFANSCPHRGASMFFGRNEEAGLRCVYHGWKFDVDGTCVDMPSEPAESNFKNKVRIGAYPAHESGGMVWTYMGPREAMPPFRDLGTEAVPEGAGQPRKQITHCNWVQAMEGNIDTSHISWLHTWSDLFDAPDDGTDTPGYPTNAKSWYLWSQDRAPRLEVEDAFYGFKYAGIRTTPNGHTHVRVTQYVMPYLTVVAGLPIRAGGSTFVPIDDNTTWRYNMPSGMLTRNRGQTNPGEEGGTPWKYPYGPVLGAGGDVVNGVIQRRYLPENDYQIDREVQKDAIFSGVENFVSQDMMVTESMGQIYDRSQEHLGTTDKAIIRMRNILIKAATDLAKGIEPPATHPSRELARVFSAEKILAPGEDWRVLGTPEDPTVQAMEAHPIRQEVPVAGS
ncbi:MAG TPA: Rieske 2Fe-2S domain-containing protein [Dehalococcoidia bacterium]|nr:Rieske 2Fe-2S domain-containing protein [Dehalococcoidia bacterium]